MRYLIDIVMVEDAVKVLVDVVEHVDHLHGRAVVAEGGETHDVAEINSHLLKQLRLHSAGLLQGTHHWAEEEGEPSLINDVQIATSCSYIYVLLQSWGEKILNIP